LSTEAGILTRLLCPLQYLAIVALLVVVTVSWRDEPLLSVTMNSVRLSLSDIAITVNADTAAASPPIMIALRTLNSGSPR
jgi:hypothetical protein